MLMVQKRCATNPTPVTDPPATNFWLEAYHTPLLGGPDRCDAPRVLWILNNGVTPQHDQVS